jgi:hypothetical protein
MLSQYHDALFRLKRVGWTVRLQACQQVVPIIIEVRYAWIPSELKQFVVELEAAVSPNEKAWLLGLPDFVGSKSTAFKWNEWERMSLGAAEGDPRLRCAIQQFWDLHFPVANSVKSGYAYFAVRKTDLCVVRGEELEFEKPNPVAPSFLELLYMLSDPDAKLSRWV